MQQPLVTDFIIVGQGLCGSWLSYYLTEAGAAVMVIDESRPNTASKAASGIINPVTGRRIVKTWLIDELMPFAREAYAAIAESTGVAVLSEKEVIDCFSTPQMRLAFLDRFAKDSQYLSLPQDENNWLPLINYDFGYGIIHPVYLVDILSLLQHRRALLKRKGCLLEAPFIPGDLQYDARQVSYRHITAKTIIFCEGAAGFDNPYFPNLPFGLNKGEYLIVHIPGFPDTHIIKKGYTLVPMGEGKFWLGSTYLWEFDNDQPTPGFLNFATNWLQQTLRMPFTVLDHHAAVRPATLERKPFVGMHPVHQTLGILNGMGTKGCSLAPYFARQLATHLLSGGPIQREADVQRFSRLLSKQ